MVSRTLIRLVDEAIIPAMVIIGAKVGSVFVLSKILDINWDLQTLSITSTSAHDFVALNSYSNLVMFLSVSVGLSWIIVKSHLFHDTHISPSFSSKLVGLNLSRFISTTVQICHQAFIWWLYAVLLTFLIIIQLYYGLVYFWIVLFSVALVVSSTWLLILDVEREIALASLEDKANEFIDDF